MWQAAARKGSIMRAVGAYLLLAVALAVLASCRDDGRAEGVLRLADSLVEERADSSLALLRRDSLLFAGAGRGVRMAYTLTKTEAETLSKILCKWKQDSVVSSPYI